jgi:hypothetical protein
MPAIGFGKKPDRWHTAAIILVAGIILSGCGAAGESGASSRSGGAPTPTASPADHAFLPHGPLEAGTYPIDGLDGPPLDIKVAVPDGWEGLAGFAVLKNDVSLGFWIVENVYTDPCRESVGLLDPPPGPTVHDLATALAAQPLRNGTDPAPIEIDGYAGEMVTLEVPADADLTACDDEEYGSWSSEDHGARGHQTPGEVDEIMIVDVDGVRLVIDASTLPNSSEEDLAELQSIIDSIQLARDT